MADSAPEKHPDSGKEETACIEQFTIPMKEWENMKAQNLRILAALGESEKVDKAKGKKRKAKGQWDSDASSQKRRVKGQWDSDASSQESESEGESHEGSPHKKRRDNLHDDTLQIDVDEQIDELFANNECKNEEDDEDDSGVKEILEDYEPEEECGLPMADKLVSVIENMAKAKILEEKRKEKIEKHKRPENCPVTVPKVNQEIWGLIDHQRDLKVQRDQRQEI